MQPRLLLPLLLVATACWSRGAPAAQAPSSAPTSSARPPGARDAIDAIRRLALALGSDDPAALDPLVDPIDGIRVWQAPGAMMITVGTITRGAGSPSQQIARTGMNGHYREEYRAELAAGLRRALAHLDVDPVDPADAIYQVRCEPMEPAARAALSTRPVLSPQDHPFYLEQGATLDRDLGLVRFVMSWRGAVAVWLVEREGKLYVGDVFVDSPCSA